NFVLNMTVLGGISRTLKFIAACEQMGNGFWCYSGETGVGSAAYLHVVAATRHIHEPSQSLFRFQIDDVIEDGPFKPKNNVLRVPEGPGLGVTLSKTGLKRCHERFLKEGPYDQYYNPDQPGMYIRVPHN
ncbi:MAG: enolase C-terminal domain-like protein, partial [Clostridiales bacterium]|nr:enolase C-terminal domain-like protein [Clostridiales bacterium]